MWYPHIYESARWEAGPGAVLDANGNLAVDPSIVADMFGDTMLANGTVYPEATVEARRYRLRILNACQARFLNLQLYEEQGPDSIVLQETGDDVWVPANPGGPGWLVIGTEGGFLAKAAPVASNVPFRVEYDAGGDPMPDTIEGSLFVGPAERFDVIVDFSGLAGKKFILYTDAPAPFPMGDPLNDFRSGSPNTRQIMRFKVVAATGNDPATDLATYGMAAGIDPLLDDSLSWTTEPQEPPEDVPVRQLTLDALPSGQRATAFAPDVGGHLFRWETRRARRPARAGANRGGLERDDQDAPG